LLPILLWGLGVYMFCTGLGTTQPIATPFGITAAYLLGIYGGWRQWIGSQKVSEGKQPQREDSIDSNSSSLRSCG
jgi:hypothetical protein